MGGKEASRGFMYQGFASILEALAYNGWDKIYVEFPTSGDKVDIALENNKEIIKSIQVKSTINTFYESSVIDWLSQIIQDVNSKEYQIFLIGHCDRKTVDLINAIKKYQDGGLDQKSQKILASVDSNLLSNKISFKTLSCDTESLLSIIRDALHRYVSFKGNIISFDQIDLIAASTITNQMLLSTEGKGVEKSEFDKKILKGLELLRCEKQNKKATIGIRSFLRGAENLEDKADNLICFLNKFEGRYLKKEYSWNHDIYSKREEFIKSNMNGEVEYKLLLDTHASIAFAAGRLLDSKSGINVTPVQKTTTGVQIWAVDNQDNNKYPIWKVSCETIRKDSVGTVIVLNVTHDIISDVKQYLNKADIQVGRVINCYLSTTASNIAITNGTHAKKLSNSLYDIISQRSYDEKLGILHVFSSVPVGFMYFLGQVSRGFGKCILYEYDFEKLKDGVYFPSISFLN
jgi:hypothetical protein